VTARDDILGRVRAALGRRSIDPASVASAAATLLADLPNFAGEIDPIISVETPMLGF